MKILFINTNQIVQKLVEVTAQKANVELVTISEPNQVSDVAQYDYIIVDDGCYNMEKAAYDKLIEGRRACLIYSKHEKMPKGFSEYIKKPFIPTHILEILVGEIAKLQAQEKFIHPADDSKDIDSHNQEDSPLDTLESLSQEYNLSQSDAVQETAQEQESVPQTISQEDLLGDFTLEEGLEILNDTNSNNEEAPKTQVSQDLPELIESDELNLDNLDIEDSTQSLANLEESHEVLEDSVGDDIELDSQKEETIEEVTLEDIPQESQEERLEQTDTAPEEATELQVLDSQQVNEVSNILDELENTSNNKEMQEENLTDGINLETLDLSDISFEEQPDEATQEAQSNESLPQEPLDSLTLDNTETDLLEENIDTESTTNTQSIEEVDLDNDTQSFESLDTKLNLDNELDSTQSLANLEESHEVLEDSVGDDIELDSQKEETIEEVTLEDIPQESQEERLEQTDTAPEEATELQEELSTEEFFDIQEDIPQEEINTLDESQPQEIDPTNLKDSQDDISLDLPPENEPTSSQQDFETLEEKDVLRAVGEEVDIQDVSQSLKDNATIDSHIEHNIAESSDNSTDSKANTSKDLEVVTNALSQSIQDSLKHMQSSELTALLDGMEVTINISFKDTHK